MAYSQTYLSFDNGATYFEIEPEGVYEFGEEQIDKMPVWRDTLTDTVIHIKNKPYEYGISALTKYRLYDAIMELDPETEVKIKFVDPTKTIYGFFGIIDCKPNAFKKTLEISPTILDQYTSLMENREKEVSIFENTNLLVNGSFDRFINDIPDGWTLSSDNSITDYSKFLDLDSVKWVVKDGYFDESLSQTIGYIGISRNIKFSFLYILISENNIINRQNLKTKIKLYNESESYYLDINGNWGSSDTSITYKPNCPTFKSAEATKYYSYSITSNPAPIAGSIDVVFYLDAGAAGFTAPSYLYLANAKLISSDTSFIELTAELNSEYLKTYKQSEFFYYDDKQVEPYFSTSPLESIVHPLTDYFDPSTGAPEVNGLLSWEYHDQGPYGKNKKGVEYFYKTFVDSIFADSSSRYYKCEISELTVFKGYLKNEGSLFKRARRWIHAIAKFSRDEYYKTDEYDDEGKLVPPEESSGWEDTVFINDKNQRLWVRLPFNGVYNEWDLGDLIDVPGQTEEGVRYQQKLTSKKVYPISDNSAVISTGISFREIVQKVYRGTHNSLLNKNVYSTFFWNDTESSAINTKLNLLSYDVGKNYASGINPNPLNNLAAIHTYDFKTTQDSDTDNATLKISFKKLIENLKVLFPQLIWFIDTDGNLHLEHIAYYNWVNDYIDITDSPYNTYVDAYQAWEYDKSEMYSLEEYTQENSEYAEFKKGTRSFAKIVSNKRGDDTKLTLNADIITTDLQYCMENPNNLENGFVLVGYEVIGSTNKVKYGTSQKTGRNVLNGSLSFGNLLYDYARYDGVWTKGKINDRDVYFKYSGRFRIGDEIKLKGIVRNNAFLCEYSTMGVAIARSKKYKYSLDSEETIITPIYRYADPRIKTDTNEILII